MKKYSWILLVLPLLAACDKEIEIDYNSVDKLYVIEGRVTNEGSEVFITQTRDMDNGVKGTGIAGASVTVTSEGLSETLVFDEADRVYRSDLIGEPGKTYTLTVEIDGQQFVSSSTMQEQVTIEPLEFQWLKIMGTRVLMCSMYWDDIAGEDNYYSLRIYQNGENYRWSLWDDKGSDGEQLSTDTYCMAEEDEDDEDDIIYEGDKMTFEVRVVDRRTYDYLYSWALAEDTSTNPLPNFTGGALGYFSAYAVTRHETIFSFDDIIN